MSETVETLIKIFSNSLRRFGFVSIRVVSAFLVEKYLKPGLKRFEIINTLFETV